MTTRYALPAVLGGQEFDGEAHGDGVIIDVPGYGNLLIPAHYVTEVTPPLPPEPPTGAVVVDRMGVPWKREGNGWFCDVAGNGVAHSWPELRDYWPLTRYVPDPAADAPELPWEGHDEEDDSIEVIPTTHTVKVRIGYDSDHSSKFVLLKPGVAREAGLALLRAAREVEKP